MSLRWVALVAWVLVVGAVGGQGIGRTSAVDPTPRAPMVTAEDFAHALSLEEQRRLGVETVYPSAWQEDLGAPWTDASAMMVFNNRLLGAVPGPELWVAPLGATEGTTPTLGTARPGNTAGLPRGMRVTALALVPSVQRIVAAGAVEARPALFVARTSPKLNLQPWEALPAFPDAAVSAIRHVLAQDEYVYVLVDRTRGTERTLGGFAMNLAVPAQRRAWLQMPNTRAREGEAAFLAGDRVVIAGGRLLERDQSAETETTRFLRPQFTPWEPHVMALPRRYQDLTCTLAGAGLFVMPRQPLKPTREDGSTSMTLTWALHLGEGRLGAWHHVALNAPAAPVRQLLVNAATAQFLVVTEATEDAPRGLHAFRLPQTSVTQPLGDEARLREHRRSYAPEFDSVPVGKALAEAKDSGMLLLMVVPGDDPDLDVDLRAMMGGPGWNYMTFNLQQAWMAGADGRDAAARFGIAKTPALLVVDPKTSKVLARHEGSLPTAKALFEVTSPSRRAQPGEEPQQEGTVQ